MPDSRRIEYSVGIHEDQVLVERFVHPVLQGVGLAAVLLLDEADLRRRHCQNTIRRVIAGSIVHNQNLNGTRVLRS